MTQAEKIDKIYDIVIKMEPAVTEHHKTLYGNGKPGLSQTVALLDDRQAACPARLAISINSKRLNISYVMMAVALLGMVASTALVVLHFVKD